MAHECKNCKRFFKKLIKTTDGKILCQECGIEHEIKISEEYKKQRESEHIRRILYGV